MLIPTHNCGGSILTSTIEGDTYDHCDRCCAFRFSDGLDAGEGLPTGTDIKTNRLAWDMSESRSPNARKPNDRQPPKAR